MAYGYTETSKRVSEDPREGLSETHWSRSVERDGIYNTRGQPWQQSLLWYPRATPREDGAQVEVPSYTGRDNPESVRREAAKREQRRAQARRRRR